MLLRNRTSPVWALILIFTPLLVSASDRWEPRAQGISRRTGNSAVWTGREMIVWGGGSQSVWLGDGGRYDLATDTWRATSNDGAPAPRWFHSAVWTGTEMLVWGGRANFLTANSYNDGARYDPETDHWRPINGTGAPAVRSQFPAIWTGTEMLVWGGWAEGDAARGDGGRYNPAINSWTPISNSNAPSARVEPTAVWTGHEMIIFGGIAVTGGGSTEWSSLNTGARYNPETDTWSPLPTENAPSVTAHTAVWTGTDMIVWGGRNLPSNEHRNTGARYNLAENRWYPISNIGAPSPRVYHASVWSGSEMLAWGGIVIGPNPIFDDGDRYNPVSDSWSPMTQVNAPHRRMFWRPDLGIWTGRGLLFYGGSDYPAELDSTAYYVPGRTDGPPEISEQPRSVTAAEGETVSFSVNADGAEPLSYQWSFNHSVIDGATNSVLTIGHVQQSDAGAYSVTVSNSVATVTSTDAQLQITRVPVVTSIAPNTGPAGTLVTISGKNFSTVAAENIVHFGGMSAAISAASSDSLTAIAPAGATFMPLIVTVNGLSAAAPAPFSPTFPTRRLDSSAFAPAQSLTPGDGPIATAIGDIDGDGRPDLVVANLYSSSVAIYRSLAPTNEAVAFAAPLSWATDLQPWDMVVADIDGDGKLDIVTANIRANTVSVLLNRSTPEHLAFSDRQDFAVGPSPHQVVVGDIDRDGRPDILIANYDEGTISVLRNLTRVGGPPEFADRVNFATAPGPHGIGVADLDGDGKLDVVVAHHWTSSPTTVVLRNTSQQGVIDLSSLTVTAHLPGTGNYLAFGDLDGDGKLDLVIPSWYEKNVSIFRNLSSPGNLSESAFGPRITLSSPGGVKRVALTDLDGDGRLDISFPTELDSALSFYRNRGGSNELDASWFESRVDLPAGWNGDGISVGDLDLDGMPDIVFCNFYDDTVWIYRAQRITPPSIADQPQNQTLPVGAPATLAVNASGGHLSYQWFHDGEPIQVPVAPSLSFNALSRADAGDYFVVVSNSGGSVTSAVATLTVIVERVLALGNSPDVNEGDLISLPLTLTSQGEVGGIDFVVQFDPSYLAAPEISWDSSLDGALKEINAPTPGQLRVALALPATAIPAGTQLLGELQLRARTVLETRRVDLQLQIIDVSDDAGDPIQYGSDVAGTSVGIANTGSLAGDNNGNHHLDIGDASLLMRLIAQVDSVRPWDLTGNDLNKNQRLDSGDVIKILRILAGIDSGPSQPSPSLIAAISIASSESASLSPSRLQGTAGQLVTVQLRLNDLQTPISGAALTLNYPVDALRLQNAQSHRVATSVPSGAVAVWNVAPAQNNYATQSGQITLALSSSAAWSASGNVLAEFTFEVQSGATSRYLWPISLGSVEITGNGYNNRTLASSNSAFVGRNAISGALLSLSIAPSGASFYLSGDQGADYRIDVSDDLIHWNKLQDVLNHSGRTYIQDAAAAGKSHRFYRNVPLR